MTAVHYVGSGDARTITGAQWTAAGITGSPADTTWNKANGWSIPAASFTALQLAILAADNSFNVNGADGPRPGATGTALDASSGDMPRALFDSINAGIQAFIKKQKGSNGPLHRQRNNFRRLGPITTDISTATNTTGHDATLTKSYTTPVTGLTSGQVRKMTDAEYAAAVYNQLPNTNKNPRIWNNSGIGYVMPCPSTLSIDETYQFPNITQQRFETMTDAPKIEFAMYAYLGTTVSSIQAYVDGSPVTLTPQTPAAAITYYSITFPAGKKPRLVEICTDALLTFISIAPNYRCWKPPMRRGPKMMVIGASYVQPFIYDAAAGTAEKYRNGHWQQMDAYADIDQLICEGIGGTGFVTNASGGIGYPTNTYLDRVAGVIQCKPDVLVIADAFSNDRHSGASNSSIIAAATSYLDQIFAALPDCRVVIQTGLRTPIYGDYTADYDTIKTALKAAYPNKIYWIDLRNVFDNTAGYTPGHTTGTGNNDFYIGADGVHPTKEGCDYMRGWLYPAIQKVLWDDGTLIGTELVS